MLSSDGGHITCLWITFFYQYMRPLLDNGYVYVAVSPLYAMRNTKGEIVSYAYSQKELENMDTKSLAISHIKGLGELDPESLWDTTLNPKNRHLIQITTKDVEDNNNILSICMGKNVEPRRDFIFKYAAF